MFTKIIAFALTLSLALIASPVVARNENDESLPRHAKKVRENTYDLGLALDSFSGKVVRGKAYVHKKANGVEAASAPACYGYIAGGIKWTVSEEFLFNTQNRSGLSSSALLLTYNASLAKWEDAADGKVDNSGLEILGDAKFTGSRLRADYGYPDGKNEVYFAGLSGGTIGITVVWYTYSGQIVEADQIYNDRSYRWSLNGAPNRMDFDNIATHENGHTFGMDDIYDGGCAEVTMYGYADYEETSKRDLDPRDITGISNLYN